MFDRRQQDFHNNDIANGGISNYSQYKVCLRCFALDQWSVNQENNTRLVEVLIDTGVVYNFGGSIVNLDNIVEGYMPDPPWCC